MTITEIDTSEADVRDFAATIRSVCESVPSVDSWTPTAPCDDRNPSLRNKLAEAGWFDVAEERNGADFLGAAGIELGRALAPVDLVDDLLGHGLALAADLGGGAALARYRAAGDTVWLCGAEGVQFATITGAEPVSYVDAQAIALIETAPGEGHLSEIAVDAWTAAMTGYIAGLTAGALQLAGGYASQRIAFGRPLADLDAVAKKIADCATTSEGLQMAARRRPDVFMLQQAPAGAFAVMRACHQILGGLGFTLEYPLQRYSRRVDALRTWTTPVATALQSGWIAE
ncbi:MAG: acyl-CoA dehydrogenase family protein [Mycobacterium sp.]